MGPVSFPFNALVGAGATYLPLDGWQYEFAPFGGAVEVILNATAVGVVAALTSGGDTIQEEAPVQAGGVAGVTPSALNSPVVVGRVKRSDRVKIRVRNTTGGGITVNGICTLVPGGR